MDSYSALVVFSWDFFSPLGQPFWQVTIRMRWLNLLVGLTFLRLTIYVPKEMEAPDASMALKPCSGFLPYSVLLPNTLIAPQHCFIISVALSIQFTYAPAGSICPGALDLH